MTIDIEPSDWSCLDPWWNTYVQPRPAARDPGEVRVLERDRFAQSWSDLDSWWQLSTTTAAAYGTDTTQVLEPDRLREDWTALDSWWETYAETGDETAVALADLLDRANDQWAQSATPFDTDPLAADLTRERFLRGPLQPGVEVEWSRWLAQLLSPSGRLVAELFDTPTTQPPDDVRREDRLPKPGSGFRRPDILVCQPDYGVSIEVKLGDENFQKTRETAALVEHHYDDREWMHVLLLPKGQRQRLAGKIRPPLVDGALARSQIAWDNPGPVEVLCWRDVSAALRTILCRGAGEDAHWTANAYLLCAVIEQRIVDFQPQPVVERLADPVDVVDRMQPIGVADTLEQQLRYLRERLEA